MKEIESKQSLRKVVKNRLREQSSFRSGKSELIWRRLHQTEAFVQAKRFGNVLIYLDFDHEVQTTRFLTDYLGFNRFDVEEKPAIYVPCCVDGEILPIRLDSPDELESGMMGILEPKPELQAAEERHLDPAQFDLILAPGLAFDLQGNRLGRGKGYYDRFLAKLSSKAHVVALAFESQIFDRIPHDSLDRPVDLVVTEERIIVPVF